LLKSKLGVKKAVLRAKMAHILGNYPVISVAWLGPTPKAHLKGGSMRKKLKLDSP
jgi:hypothetical protein